MVVTWSQTSDPGYGDLILGVAELEIKFAYSCSNLGLKVDV